MHISTVIISVKSILRRKPDQEGRFAGNYIRPIAKWPAITVAGLEGWDGGFESHSRHGCLCARLSCVGVVLCVGTGLATG
jgi:hypothetical protein